MTVPINWTGDMLARLDRDWLAGASAQVVANRLGGNVTRNAVIGQVYRRGLKRAPNITIIGIHGAVGACVPRICKPRKPARPPKPVPVPRIVPTPPVVCLAHARPFMSRASRECAWILDDGRSCCAQTTRGSYCAGHGEMVYRPVKTLAADKMARQFG